MRHFCILLLSQCLGCRLLMLQCLVDSTPHCFVVVMLDVERFDSVVDFGAKDRSDSLHLFVHVFRSADLAGCVTLGCPRQDTSDDVRAHWELVFGNTDILWMVFVIKVSRRTSEIFNDDLGLGHGICIVVAIFCEHALVLGCLLLSHVASFHRLVKVEENLSSRESLPFSEMWLIGMPW